ncbi:MAG: hypothetical protein LBP59_02285 [Planctomycetaceae bacterium]|jgi:hypothetical protein|nr:hypothetical protein [Planctomycetaceae bacterium]
MKISEVKKYFLNDFILGLIVGCGIMFAFYTVYHSYIILDHDKFWIKTNSEYIKKILPPNLDKFESYMSNMDNLNRAFAYMNYNSIMELYYENDRFWKPKTIISKFPTSLEYKSLREFKLANKGYNEYLNLLKVKYGNQFLMDANQEWQQNMHKNKKYDISGDTNIKSENFRCDQLGQLVKQTRLDSGKPIIVTKNKFDNAGRLLNISHTGDNKTYADYDIKWDEGNRITDFDFTYLNGPAKKNTSNYRYDKTAQLINANYSFMPNEKYNFDLNGNRKTAEIQGQNQNYKTGEYNRLLSDNENTYNYDNE